MIERLYSAAARSLHGPPSARPTDPGPGRPVIAPTPLAPPLRFPLDRPAETLALRVGAMPGASLLEGGPGFGEAGRWSILAARPPRPLRGPGRPLDDPDCPTAARPAPGTRSPRSAGSWTGLAPVAAIDGDDLPPFLGGLIGFYGYDLAPLLERLPRRAPREGTLPRPRVPPLRHLRRRRPRDGTATLWVVDLLGEPARAVELRARHWLRRLEGPPAPIRRSRFDGPPAPSVTPDELPPRRRPDGRVHPRRRHLPGEHQPAVRRRRATRAAGPLPPAPTPEPGPVLRVPPLAGRGPGGRQRQPRVVLPDPRRPDRHPADQGDPAPRRDPRGGRRPGRRARSPAPRTAPS